MKKNYIILLFTLVLWAVLQQSAHGQSNFNYTYDLNGNRILRQLDTSPPRIAASPLEEEEEEASQEITVYPNPGTGIFQVSIPQAAEEVFELKVFNLSGSLVYVHPNPTVETMINLKDQPTGIYLFKVKSNTRSNVIRIIKE